MTTETRHYVAILPGDKEYPFELPEPVNTMGWAEGDLRQKLNTIVRDAGIRTSRTSPQIVSVDCHRLSIEKGQIRRDWAGNYAIMPPLEDRTADELAQEKAEMLRAIPVEFHNYVNTLVYEQCEGQCDDVIINTLQEWVMAIATPLAAYLKRRGIPPGK